MGLEKSAIASGLAGAGVSAAAGAATGGGIGAAFGGVGAGTRRCCWRNNWSSAVGFFGGVGASVEANNVITEAILDNLGDQEATEENVRRILNDDSIMFSGRAKALARGVTIGVIDGITGGLAGKAGGAVLKGGVGAASRVGRKGTALGVKMGAAVGETAAQLVTDGHVDGFEVYAEAIGEFGAGSLNVFTLEVAAFAGYKAPEYKINGQAVSARQMIEHLNSGQLINNVEINNDSQMENRLSEVASDQAQPLEDVRTRVKRALFNRGYKATNDQIDDATADAFEDAKKALDAKDDSALNAAISRAVDRKIAKGRVSSVDVETEERSSRVSALSESSSDSRGSVAQELSDRAERSRKAAKEANTDEERAALNEAAETLEKKGKGDKRVQEGVLQEGLHYKS